MIPPEWLNQAVLRIAPHLRRTLLTNDAGLNIYLKWENQQVTGSFKLRGALNKVLSLEKWEQEAGLVTASAGNHGQGVALAGNLVNAPVTIFASNHAVTSKVKAMRALGAEVRLVEGGYEAAEQTAIRFASEHSKTWVSAYNDGQVIAGQGTIGLEIAQELPPQAGMTWLAPVGGGGLLAGIGAALTRYRVGAAHKERPRLVGVQAEASAFMHSLFYRDAQENIPDLPTLADGLSGRIEDDSLTIPMLKQFADDIILVSEEEIAQAIAFAWHKYHQRIEGSAAVSLAPILSGKVKPPAVVVISGGNIQPEVHAAICRRYAELR
ncbi:MAG: pyridoxal-phosphate dependent enzyme [Anaerolineales bacterium]|nr:pyridoxal-phosphate dependent enzyme [Anaerolineales bacterium]